jgi:hypothetical protein
MRMAVPITNAIIALERGQPAQALEVLDAVTPYDHAPSAEFWPAYLRGRAHLQLRDGRRAAEAFRAIVDHRGEVPASVLYPLSHLGLAQAAVLNDDPATARESYQRFLTLWKNADPDLAPLKQARVEYARLSTRQPDPVSAASR